MLRYSIFLNGITIVVTSSKVISSFITDIILMFVDNMQELISIISN